MSVETSLRPFLNTLSGAFIELVSQVPLRPWNTFTQHRWEQRTVSAVVYWYSWFLSALCLVGGENLSQTDFLGSFCYKGCLSGQSAGEALSSRWLTWQPPWITLLVKAHSQPSKAASFSPPFSYECADYAI